MMTDRKFEDRKKLEKAAALVALATDKGGYAGPCLLAEELAALVDGRCDREQRALFLHHLGGCDRCYGQWLSLRENSAHRALERRSHRLAGMKKYGYLGSALALAASVVLFLHIAQPPSLVREQSLSRPEALQPAGESAGSGSFSTKKEMTDGLEKDRNEAPAPVSQPTPVRKTLKAEMAPTAGGQALHRQTPAELSAPATEAGSRPAQKASPAGTAGDEQMAGTVDAWLQQLQQNCLADNRERAFWAQMHRQGEKFLDPQAGSISEEQQKRVAATLVLLQAMATKPVPEQCRLLLAVLAEDHKSR